MNGIFKHIKRRAETVTNFQKEDIAVKYIVTGVDGKLGGRVAENMLKEVKAEELIFTCPFLERLNPEKKNVLSESLCA